MCHLRHMTDMKSTAVPTFLVFMSFSSHVLWFCEWMASNSKSVCALAMGWTDVSWPHSILCRFNPPHTCEVRSAGLHVFVCMWQSVLLHYLSPSLGFLSRQFNHADLELETYLSDTTISIDSDLGWVFCCCCCCCCFSCKVRKMEVGKNSRLTAICRSLWQSAEKQDVCHVIISTN